MKRTIAALLSVLCILFLLSVSVCAQDVTLPCVTDEAVLLDEAQLQRLEEQAQRITREYGVGVYIAIVEDYWQLDPSGPYDAAYTFYHDNSLGAGENQSGILLLLSMAERDYALYCYGDEAVYAFNEYAIQKLEDAFLDELGSDDWEGGFEAYLQTCDRYLEKAAAGSPVKKSPMPRILISWVIALAIAAVACAVMAGRMKTVRKKTNAAAYAGNLSLTEQFDHFTHRTESRRRIERNQRSGGGGSPSGGSSGKF